MQSTPSHISAASQQPYSVQSTPSHISAASQQPSSSVITYLDPEGAVGEQDALLAAARDVVAVEDLARSILLVEVDGDRAALHHALNTPRRREPGAGVAARAAPEGHWVDAGDERLGVDLASAA